MANYPIYNQDLDQRIKKFIDRKFTKYPDVKSTTSFDDLRQIDR